MAPALPSEWEMPKLRYSLNFEDTKSSADDANSDTEFFDVKFYPYNPPGSNPVFAAVSKRHIFVCRLIQTKDSNPCEIIRVIRDEDEGALNCSCTWARDPQTERALLCVAGRDAKVKVYNIRDGEAVTSFVGHGGEINDLATCPTNPHLIVSASDDTTVRLWSLDPVHKKQPCVCLLGGEGHSWNLLSVAFHDSGRYVISAGHDQVINLWTLPDIPNDHVEVPIIVHFPHFSTSEIHTGLIDCVAFYGDLILSRACLEDVIVLWRIEGFDSTAEPPSPEQAPSNQDTTKVTRSAFHVPLITSPSAVASANANNASTVAASTTPQYTRLLQLHTPGCGPQFFMRFGLFNVAGHHPMLAFCNAAAKIFFWDFTCFSAYRQFMTANHRRERQMAQLGNGANGTNGTENGAGAGASSVVDEGPVPRPPWMRIVVPRKRPTANGGHSNSNTNSSSANPGGRRTRDAANGLGLLGSVHRDGEGSDHESSVVSGAPGAAAEGASIAAGAANGGTPSASTPVPTTTTNTTGATPKGRSAVGYSMSDLYNKETLDDWDSKYNANDPHVLVKAHKAETTKGLSAVGRQAAWSPEGEWCVVVGSNSRVMILQRWANSNNSDNNSHPVEEAEQ